MSNQVLEKAITFCLCLFFAQASYGLCIKSSKAYLRSKPSANSQLKWVVGRYMPLVQVGKKGNWLQVADLDGERHWVYSALLTQKFQCAVIKTERANIRRGPGSRFGFSDYRVALRYESFMRKEKKGNWYRLVNELGEVGWIHQSNLWLPLRKVQFSY